MEKIIFDTNIFRKILDGLIDLKTIIDNKNKVEYIATHIQKDEIEQCKDAIIKEKLLSIFKEIDSKQIPTETIVLGVSRLGMSKFSDGVLFEKLRKSNLKHTEDALIGETAIKNKLILVSEDRKFRNRVNKEGGKAIKLKEFEEMLK